MGPLCFLWARTCVYWNSNEFKMLSFCFCEKTPGQRFMTWSLDIRVLDEILQCDLLKQTRNNDEAKKFLTRRRLILLLIDRPSLMKVDSLHTPAPVVGFSSQSARSRVCVGNPGETSSANLKKCRRFSFQAPSIWSRLLLWTFTASYLWQNHVYCTLLLCIKYYHYYFCLWKLSFILYFEFLCIYSHLSVVFLCIFTALHLLCSWKTDFEGKKEGEKEQDK